MQLVSGRDGVPRSNSRLGLLDQQRESTLAV